jgi:hypothetical protein
MATAYCSGPKIKAPIAITCTVTSALPKPFGAFAPSLTLSQANVGELMRIEFAQAHARS